MYGEVIPLDWQLINLADFSTTPGGRFREHGKYSGEEFLEDVLLPILDKHEVVEVELGDCVGITNSFMEEVFGGVIRRGIDPSRVIPIATNRPFRATKALKFMSRALALKSMSGADK